MHAVEEYYEIGWLKKDDKGMKTIGSDPNYLSLRLQHKDSFHPRLQQNHRAY
jgi:hypothetical protein